MLAPLQFNQRDLGHGASDTVLHPVVAVALLVTIVLMLWRPRKYAIVPLLLCTFLVPRGQEVMLAGAHVYVRLILALAGFICVVKDKFRIVDRLNIVDKIFIVWACYRVFATVVTNWPSGVMEQLSFLLSALCGYFLLRYLIANEEDVARAAKTLAVVALVLGACMVYEHHFRVNPFGTFGWSADRPGNQRRNRPSSGHVWSLDSRGVFWRHAHPSLRLVIEQEELGCCRRRDRGIDVDGADGQFQYTDIGVCGRHSRPPFVAGSAEDEGGPLANRDHSRGSRACDERSRVVLDRSYQCGRRFRRI